MAIRTLPALAAATAVLTLLLTASALPAAALAQPAPGPSRDGIVSALNQELGRFIASFSQCAGGDIEKTLDPMNPLSNGPWASFLRPRFDEALSRVELGYLRYGVSGYLLPYTVWLRYRQSPTGITVLPSSLRGATAGFADYVVAHPDAHLVGSVVLSLDLSPDAAAGRGRNVCSSDEPGTVSAVSDMLNRAIAGDASFSTEQSLYLAALATLPQMTLRTLYAETAAAAGGWGAQGARDVLSSLAQQCADDPYSCQEPFFTKAARQLGFLNGQ